MQLAWILGASSVVITLCTLSFFVNSSIYKTERPSLNRFLNYGVKKYKPSLGLRNEVIKSKVTVLGDILKKQVHHLRKVPGQSVELVFLVDSSASVGAENFISELKFVKKLLADFVVSYNHTRVAVITFSSRSKVIRHIDHVAHASHKNHKCSLLERELPRIRYSGGGTYTLGALLEAQGVLAVSRGNTVKAVFLVTDGYSNGGDPRPAAQFLKDKGVIIFTFGIKNGNIKELYDMASHPREEHSYILDSFQEFEALARRALHEDLQNDVIVDQQDRECNLLCKKGFKCCDKQAYCTCGAHTGLYACTCRKGYYGTGLKGDCRKCPVATYRDYEGPGDIATCRPCPDKYMTSNRGSTSLFHCFCRKGYIQTGLECEKNKCPAIDLPENAYFIRDHCENVINAACGIRCGPGYDLVGSSIRLCKENGTWSGTDSKCVMKTCPKLEAPRRGFISCSSGNQEIDSVCYISCKPGYRLIGSKYRTCLPVAMWDGIKPYCKSITCHSHPGIKHGIITPSACNAKKVKYGTVCDVICKQGFTLKERQQISCNADGTWAGGKKQRCIDIDPPVITCPKDVYADADLKENFVEVTWSPPITKDSSGGRVFLSTKPVVSRPMKFKIGTHRIIYKARDKWGNKANCSFTVTIEDKEPPQIDWCESPPAFISKNKDVDVYWEEPIFSDNSGQVLIDRSREPGKFNQGETVVEYWAIDDSGNKATCYITIKVQPHACEMPVGPINGDINCTESPEAIYCTLTCHEGFAFAMSPQQDYFCAYDGIWMPNENPMPFPECSVSSISNTITHSGEMAVTEEGTSVCNDIFLMSQLENKLAKKLEEALDDMCSEDIYCNVETVEAVCESILADMEEDNNSIYSRKKRNVNFEVQIRSLWPEQSADFRYWFRGFLTDQFIVSELAEGLVSKKRVKRQFGFPTGMFEKGNSTISNKMEDEKANFIGVLTSLILQSLGNDIGIIRFSSFLSRLDSKGKPYGMEDFLASFAKEFGEEKAKSVRYIAEQKLGKFISKDSLKLHALSQENKSGGISVLSTTESLAEIYTPDGKLLNLRLMNISHVQADGTLPPIDQKEEKKSLKVKFKVQGSGTESSEKVKVVMNGILSLAEKGQFDVDFGARQLKVAAIRLSEFPEYICDPGSILIDKLCVKCPIGTFFNVITKTCQSCPPASFQPKEGQVSCLVCPENTSTKALQAKSDQDCKAMCLPGSFSSDTLEPCTSCPIGSFQDEYASLNCTPCTTGTTTWRRGSWVLEECKVPCSLGYISETGLQPCFPCPTGSFQSNVSQTTCYICPNASSTNSTGSDSIYSCAGISSDHQITLSQLETIEINSCFSSPCENEGSCNALEFGYVCLCPPGYSGQQCESEIDECLSEPCLNNGTCIDKLADFKCRCEEGFEGKLCEVNIDECVESPCMNNGSCIDLINSFDCICDSGYTGDVCDINIDDCENSPCENGASCLDGVSDYSCTCPPGYTGRMCQYEINECENSPCIHGACIDHVANFSCECEAGYHGHLCESNVNDCKNDTCSNEAICHDLINGFKCECKPGYAGQLCEKELSSDYVMEMRNPGVMDYAKLDNLPSELNEVSVCFWMKTYDSNNYGTPFSYATKESDNALTLTDYSGFVFYVNGNKEVTDVTANDGYWHMICCTWQSNSGKWTIYKNAQLVDSGSGLSAGQNISSIGSFVIGQEQDEVGGRFNSPESFIGEITLLNVWDEVLSDNRIKKLFICCQRYVGNMKGWPDFQTGVMGNIKIKQSRFCRGCGLPQVPNNARLVNNGSEPGSTVKVICNTGHKLYRGDDERTCRIDGIWSGDPTECKAVYCDYPKPLYHGEVRASTNTYGDILFSSCNAGYRLLGLSKRKCLADGKWKGEEPSCEMVTCNSPMKIENAVVVSGLRSYLPTNKVIYSCLSGYQMDGPATKTCSRSGKWKGGSTECQPISCGKIPKIKNRNATADSEEVFAGRFIYVECSNGFVLEKSMKLVCLNDGTWQRPVPKCVLPSCQKPPTVKNGKVIVRASTTEREAFYKCQPGYIVTGKETLRCTTNGTWDHAFSDCLPQLCTEPPTITNGGVQKQDNWRVGNIAKYSCDEGYLLTGDSSLECNRGHEEGEWQGVAPSCLEIFCSRVHSIPSGVHTIHPPTNRNKWIVFPTIRYKRALDLALKHRENYDTVDGSYGQQSIGVIGDDPLLTGLDNSPYVSEFQIIGFPNHELLSADFNDYGLTSLSQSVDDPGQFSQSVGFDDYDQSFDDPGKISQSAAFDDYGQGFDDPGQISQSVGSDDYGRGFDDPDQISQSVGFDDYDQGFDDGQISQSVGFDDYDQVFHDPNQISQSVGFDDSDSISASQGKDIGQISQSAGIDEYDQISQDKDGNEQVSQVSGFDHDVIGQTSDFDDMPSNLATKYPYNTTIKYECVPGYKLLGSPTRRCSESGDWDEPQPRCYEIFCPDLAPVEGGYLLYHGSGLNSKVEYVCYDEYLLLGEKELICSANKQWIGTVPSCINIDCGIPHEPENGTVEYASTYFGAIATYECAEGFVFEGVNERYCDVTGYWNGSLPRCTAITCDVPPVIKNGYITFEGSLYAGSPVEYMCKECYELIGTVERICQMDGSWTLQPPTCELSRCEALPKSLEHGKVMGNDIICGSIVEYECDLGYILKGARQSKCSESRTWTKSVPYCEPKSCGTPPSVENSKVSGTSHNYMGNIEYTCDKGYIINGTRSLSCNEYGIWTGDTPKCSITYCQKPKGPSNGKVRLSGLFYMSEALIVCDPGFELDGDDHLICIENGKWDKELPYCVPTLCSAAPRPPNSFYNSSELYFESFSTLLYNCSTGYITNIQNTLMTCNSDAEWTGTIIDCYPVDCGHPVMPTNGNMLYNTSDDSPFVYDKIVAYNCDTGYELIGEATILCLPEGIWNGAAVCVQITCKHLEVPDHAVEKHITTDRHYGTFITYTCKEGYFIDGTPTIECQEDGLWSSSLPTCMPVKCLEPIEIFGAMVIGDNYEYNNIITIQCIDGYSIKGESLLTCTAKGLWSDEFPTCDMITCNNPSYIPNGKWEKVMTDNFIKPERIGYHLIHSGQSKLAKITDILEKQSEKLLFKLGQFIEYTCDEGYDLLSSTTSRCTEEGWKPPSAECQAITCPQPIDIKNGMVKWHNLTYGTTIYYKCDVGYEINGDTDRFCQLNGLWSSITPHCTPIICPLPEQLLYGTITGSDFQFRSRISINCNPGFNLTGSATRTCQSNGLWSGEDPTCIEIFCGHPGNIPHAELYLSGFTVGNKAIYSCKEGYEMYGESARTCLSSGKWEYKKPQCIIIDCGRPKLPKNGFVLEELTTYNSMIHYSCKKGYKLAGNKRSTCLESRLWSGDIPSCRRITCHAPLVPIHSSIKRDNDESTDKHDYLTSSHSAKYKKTKKQSKKGKNKKRKNIKKKEKIANHDYYAFDSIIYKCERGWFVEGKTKLTCTTEGVWTGAAPTCRKITCDTPPLPENALYTGDDFSYGEEIDYYCSQGYILKGNNRLSCGNDGMWKGNLPSCEPVDCGGPLVVPNSDMVVEAFDHGQLYKYGSIALYSCKPGYRLEGLSAVMCDADGKWKNAGKLPECKEKLCQKLPRILDAQADQSTVVGRQFATFSCNRGYFPVGDPNTSCHLGRWNIANFTCLPVDCKQPGIPEHSIMSASAFTYGSAAQYSCIEGYRMQGNSKVDCGPDSLWLGDLPTCIKIDCGHLEKLEHGDSVYSSTNYLSYAEHNCDRGYKLKGSTSRICSSDGKWSGHVPQCQRISCSEPKPPKDGYVVGSKYFFGESVQFVCKKGYVLLGSSHAVCGGNGKWSSEDTTCEAVFCNPPKPVSNSYLDLSINKSHPYETKMEHGCKDGFIARGDLSSDCLQNGTWSLVKGRCSRMACGRPILKQNDALVIGRSYYYKDSVRFLCPPGAKLNGSSTAICLSTGAWSSASSCVPGCRRSCKNGGICIEKNICTCPPGFIGDNCEKALCSIPCLNGGTCIGPFQCSCLPQFEGHRCEKPVCESGCGKYGRCIGPNVCLCRFGKVGSTCNETRRGRQQETYFQDWDISAIRS